MRYHLFAHWWYDHGQGGKEGYIESSDSKEKLIQKFKNLPEINESDFQGEIFDSELLQWEDVDHEKQANT
jgi:hypothetical protein